MNILFGVELKGKLPTLMSASKKEFAKNYRPSTQDEAAYELESLNIQRYFEYNQKLAINSLNRR